MSKVQELFLRALELRTIHKSPFAVRRIFEEEAQPAENIEAAMQRLERYRDLVRRIAISPVMLLMGFLVILIALKMMEKLHNPDSVAFKTALYLVMAAALCFVLLGLYWLLSSLIALKKIKNLP
jgi:uncharacterized membrane protein YcjF (UPF0283 family)